LRLGLVTGTPPLTHRAVCAEADFLFIMLSKVCVLLALQLLPAVWADASSEEACATTEEGEEAALLQLRGGAEEELQGSYGTVTCYTNTGGSCYMGGCNASRAAKCVSSTCVCEGACAGANGQCYKGATNKQIAKGFKLKNYYWPKYSMYFQGESIFGQIKTTNAYSALNLHKDMFNLYKLPGASTKNASFFLSSYKYTDLVARIGLTTGTALKTHGFYATALKDGKSPDVLAVHVCYDAKHKAIMIGNVAQTWWAYVHRGSWLVYGSAASSAKKSTVGTGGLWKPEPMFTKKEIAELPSC